MSDSPELQALLDSLMHPELKVIDLSLDRMRRYLDAHNNPEKHMPPVVHVAGTNGKGSAIAFLRAMLESAGYRVHTYTSPHLLHFRERILLAGEEVSDDELIPLFHEIKARTDDYPLTFFEATSAAAFELFAKHDADIALLEVGLGGRYDATNVIPNPILSVITPISMDHMDYLGDTIKQITGEKAAIIKHGVPVVCAPQEESALTVIEEAARAANAPFYDCDNVVVPDDIGLLGAHQRVNAATAWQCAIQLEKAEFSIPFQDKMAGLQNAKWAGRLQKIESGKLVDMLSDGQELWLDGGHNAAAGRALAEWIAQQKLPVHVICAMVSGKDYQAFLAPIIQKSASLSLTTIPNEPLSAPIEALEEAVSALSADYSSYNDPKEAICAQKTDEGLVLCCGSLYFVGKLLDSI